MRRKLSLLYCGSPGNPTRQVLQYGADAEVLEPAALREFMRETVGGGPTAPAVAAG